MKEQHLGIMIHEQCRKYKNREELFYKKGNKWIGIKWNEMKEQIDSIAKALIEFGAKEGENIAIYGDNTPWWALSEYAIFSIRATAVPIYATNTKKEAEYIINDAKIQTIFVGSQFQYDNIIDLLDQNEYLNRIIIFDQDVKIERSDRVMYYDDFMEIGKPSSNYKELEDRLSRAKTDDICDIIYTSGTTGDPKGAMLTHQNFYTMFRTLDERFPMGKDDIEMCFIPMSHAYEKASGYWVQSRGAKTYYCEDTNKIVEYFQEVKPTYMCGVPRLYEKMYAAIYEQLEKASEKKKKLFNWAIETGKEYQFKNFRNKPIPLSLRFKHRIAYALVLKKIRAILGGKLNFFSAGGAPLSKEIEEFFFAAKIFIAQGYGLTETAPMNSCNAPDNFRFGSVGAPITEAEIKIADDGEIFVRGPHVFKGYYNKPEKTKEALSSDGWFRTGDIGHLDEDGFLYITDRKKDIIITAGGKNISPQNIESTIGMDFYIEQAVVIGERRKYLTALIVPSFEALEEWADRNKIRYETVQELVKNKQVIDFYRQRIDGLSKNLARYETLKKFTLLPRSFTQEDGEITPTMKIKRKAVNLKYKEQIDLMYEEQDLAN